MANDKQIREMEMEGLLFSMRRALIERRQVVEVAGHRFRFQRRGESFEEGDREFQALQSGVFAYFRATAGGVEVPGRWVHLGSSDDLEDIMAFFVNKMSAKEIRDAQALICANAALQSMAKERAESNEARYSEIMSSAQAVSASEIGQSVAQNLGASAYTHEVQEAPSDAGPAADRTQPQRRTMRP